jgi:hypothetical protein
MVMGITLGWLARDWRFVRERHAALADFPEKGKAIAVEDVPPHLIRGPIPNIPFWREWMGDRAILLIFLWPRESSMEGMPDPDTERFTRLFPEAIVQRETYAELAR